MTSISFPPLSTQEYINQAQALAKELFGMSIEIHNQVSNPSMQQFAKLYISYEDTVLTGGKLNKIASLKTEKAFQDALKTCKMIIETANNDCVCIFTKLTENIYHETIALITTAQNELAKKCDELFQRIQTLKILQRDIEKHPSILFALNTIESIRPHSQNQTAPLSVQECIEKFSDITRELLDLDNALFLENNTSNLLYFKPIAIALKNVVRRGNEFLKLRNHDKEFIRAKKVCLNMLTNVNNKTTVCIHAFIGKLLAQTKAFAKNTTQTDLEKRGPYYALKKDIDTLLEIKPSLKSNPFIEEALAILNGIQKKCSIPDQLFDLVSSSSSSSLTSSSSHSSSSSLDSTMNQDILTPPDHKDDRSFGLNRRGSSPTIGTGPIFSYNNLRIVIPEDNGIDLPITKSYGFNPVGEQAESIRGEDNPDLRNEPEQFQEEIEDPKYYIDLLEAIALSMTK